MGSILVLAIVGYVAWTWIDDEPADTLEPGADTVAQNTQDNASDSSGNDSTAQPASRPDRLVQDTFNPKPQPKPQPQPKSEPKPEPSQPAPQPKPASNDTSSNNTNVKPSASTARIIDAAQQMIAQGQMVKGRDLLNEALTGGNLAGSEAASVRRLLEKMNRTLILSPEVNKDDPWTDTYVVQSGDLLSKIADQYNVPWELLSYVNGNLDPRRLRVGARLKVVKGPFHAVVDKSDFRMDIYLGKPGRGGMFVRSFHVGLGEYDATPIGEFIVKKHSKLKNPEWTNPRTGEKYLADDPENPLGEYWVGLQGVDANTEVLKGYGIHGTIEPDTIGTQASMGCVRLLDEDIKLTYFMLQEQLSRVVIVQ